MQGYYEAMLMRYHHFAYDARLQRLKLVEFVLAVLHQDRQRHSASTARALLGSASADSEVREAACVVPAEAVGLG